jgi:L-ribulose-5-phosphate 3-epimerase
VIKCISYWSIAGGLQGTCPISEAVSQAKAAGFAGIELAIAEEGLLTPSTDQSTCTEYCELVQRHGLVLETLASGMSWGCSPTHLDGSVRRKSIDLHAAALQRAAWLGCRSMLFVPGAITIPWDPFYPAVPYDKAVQWAREATTVLARIAEGLRIELCIENVWNGLFYSPLELQHFVDSIHSSAVGVYFDAGNVLGYHQHPRAGLSPTSAALD